MIYFVNFIILSINSLLERFVRSKVFLFISTLLLICFAGFRGFNVGPDTLRYANYYQETHDKIGVSYFEPGYRFLEHFCASLNFSTFAFFLFISLITMVILVVGFNYMTMFPTSILVYYYARFFMNRNMGQIRAALAASIILFSLRYIVNEKPVYFIFFCLLASTIHKSALIALIIYPFNYFIWKVAKTKRKIVVIVILIFVISAVVSIIGSNIIYNIFNVLSEAYVDNNNDNAKLSYGLNNPVILMQVIITILALISLNLDKRVNKVIISTYILSTILIITLSHYYVLAGRFSSMLATVEPLLILKVNNHFFGTKLVSSFSFLLISLVIFWLINIYTGALSPYELSF